MTHDRDLLGTVELWGLAIVWLAALWITRKPGSCVRSRGQVLATIVVVAVVIAGAMYAEREVGARDLTAGPAGAAPSGAWFCPHGGGPRWV